MKKTDGSNYFVRMLENLSNFLAKRRGLPIIAGIVLVVISGILDFVALAVNQPVLDAVEIVVRTLGITIALIGILLLEPLGK
jgi:hypothetical protein